MGFKNKNKNKFKSIQTNKKGIGFFALIAPISVILLALIFITHISDNNSIANNLKFGDTLSKLDMINSKIPAEQLYRDELFKHLFTNIKSDFSKNYHQTQQLSLENFKKDTINSCSIFGIDIWYNQNYENYVNTKNLNENSNPSDDSGSSSSSDSNNIETLTQVKKNICTPDFKNDFTRLFKLSLKLKIDNSIQDNMHVQDFSSLNINIDNKNKNSDFNISILSNYDSSTLVSKIIKEFDYTSNYNLGLYPDLLSTIQDTFPKLEDDFKSSIPSCITKNINTDFSNENISIEDYCFTNAFKKLVYQQDNSNTLKDNFDFKLNVVSDFKKDGFYLLKVEIIDKKSNHFKSNNLIFGILLKDNIPYSDVTFSLANSLKYDNVIDVTINMPKFKVNKNDNYVIVYSYKNFFNNVDLVNLLNNQGIVNEFKSNGFYDPSPISIDDIYSIKDDSKFVSYDVDLAMTSNNYFKDGKKTVSIYQKYNHDSKKFELFKNKELYVYVFAVDKKNNYYLDNFDAGKKISIKPKPVYGPNPLTKENLQIKSDKDNFENSIFLKTINYNNSNFNYYDLYIYKNNLNSKLNNQCKDNDNCYYYNGKNTLTNKDLNLLIHSDQSFTLSQIENNPDLNNPTIITTTQFSPQFKFTTNDEYNLLVIPVDKQGNSILNSVQKYTNGPIQRSGTNGYKFAINNNQDASMLINPVVNKVTIFDKKAPNPTESIIINSNQIDNDNKLQLIFSDNTYDDQIDYLNGHANIYDLDKNLLESFNFEIRLNDGYIRKDNSDIVKFDPSKYSSIVLDKIYPVDKSGNSYYGLDTNLETYSEEFKLSP